MFDSQKGQKAISSAHLHLDLGPKLRHTKWVSGGLSGEIRQQALKASSHFHLLSRLTTLEGVLLLPHKYSYRVLELSVWSGLLAIVIVKKVGISRPRKEFIQLNMRPHMISKTILPESLRAVGFLWKPYVPRRNDGILYSIYILECC
jgi:hypothetical protein